MIPVSVVCRPAGHKNYFLLVGQHRRIFKWGRR
jgi:hypothetical protein